MISDDPEQPAFPRSYVADGHNGMTLRDYFANSALRGLLSCETNIQLICDEARHDGEYADAIAARLAYEYADAMIRERAKPKTP